MFDLAPSPATYDEEYATVQLCGANNSASGGARLRTITANAFEVTAEALTRESSNRISVREFIVKRLAPWKTALVCSQ